MKRGQKTKNAPEEKQKGKNARSRAEPDQTHKKLHYLIGRVHRGVLRLSILPALPFVSARPDRHHGRCHGGLCRMARPSASFRAVGLCRGRFVSFRAHCHGRLLVCPFPTVHTRLALFLCRLAAGRLRGRCLRGGGAAGGAP